jgi:NADH:ubiquinone oxidoreductase subunit 6 (subunit J)
MVLMLFVIMMLNMEPGALKWRFITGGRIIVASGAVYLAAALSMAAWTMFKSSNVQMFKVSGTIEGVGELLITKYAVPFELLGVLLLAAVVGAVVMSRK